MNNYYENDYSNVEMQIMEHQELIITRHFGTRMVERGITYKELKKSLNNPKIIRHEGSYDHYGNLRIKYTLQSRNQDGEEIGVVCAVNSEKIVILITVMFFWEEIGWEQQTDGLYVKNK
ncbi:MAG: DUF4258 domain-containing protein [Halanaerobiales bacterium]|nr:DUF4258 domain-containing protein [Halanaerobiales bacterium]